MVAYTYTRNILTAEDEYKGQWDLPNPQKITGDDKTKYLENMIKAASGTITKTLVSTGSVVCNGATCTINFTEALSAAEETALDAVVAAHIANQ